jgi:hypothetical protein
MTGAAILRCVESRNSDTEREGRYPTDISQPMVDAYCKRNGIPK